MDKLDTGAGSGPFKKLLGGIISNALICSLDEKKKKQV